MKKNFIATLLILIVSIGCAQDIIIVGGGVSGLYAAAQLKKCDFDVLVLEASDTYGGRVRPVKFSDPNFGADFPVELGAEEVHGNLNKGDWPMSFMYRDINNYDSSLLERVRENALNDELYEIDGTAVWDYGNMPPFANAYCCQYETEIEAVWTFTAGIDAYNGIDQTIYNHLKKDMGIDETSRTYHFYDQYIGAENGGSIKEISMRGLAAYYSLWKTGDNNYALNNSYLDILSDIYFQDIIDNNLQLNTQVTSINYNGSQVIVTDQNALTYTAKAVLVTVPVTILQDGDISFTPALPIAKIDAINKIGMSSGMKIVLKFNAKFWENDMFGVLVDGNTGEFWAPGHVRSDATNNVLMGFVMGEKAQALSNLNNNDSIISLALEDLDRIFGGTIASALFDKGLVMDWSRHPYVRGAYSYPIIGTYPSSGLSMREILAQPVNNKLFFAGEATSNDHAATVHGALESGARAADEICTSVIITSLMDEITALSFNAFDDGKNIHISYLAKAPTSLSLDFYNTLGQKVETQKVYNSTIGRNTTAISPNLEVGSIYIMKITLNNTIHSIKLVR